MMQEINPKKEEKEPVPEIEELVSEAVGEKIHEKKEVKPEETEIEKAVREKLKKEIDELTVSPELTVEAKKKAKKIKDLDQKGKLKRLLELAEEKGVSFAVQVAKSMKDPFILDLFHDILAKEGLYKKFKK